MLNTFLTYGLSSTLIYSRKSPGVFWQLPISIAPRWHSRLVVLHYGQSTFMSPLTLRAQRIKTNKSQGPLQKYI